MHSLAFSALLTLFHLSQALKSLKKKIASMHMDEEMRSPYFFFLSQFLNIKSVVTGLECLYKLSLQYVNNRK